MKHLNRRFLELSAVNILSNLMVPIANLIDIAFLGHLEQIRHLAGVALAAVLFSYIYWSFGFLRMGTTGTTAQAAGRGDGDEVILTALRHGLAAVGIGAIILLLQQPLRELGFALLSADPEVKAAGRDYYNALIWGAPATLLNFVLLGWFLGREQGTKVLLLSALDKGVNVVLNYLFIVRLHWASAGAGWATAASQYLTLAVGILLVCRELRWQTVRALAPRISNRAALSAIFTLNRDIMVRTLALISTFAVFTNLGAALGTEVLVANTLLLQVVTLGAYFIDGLAFATESIAGNCRGQGDTKQLRALVKLSGAVSLGIGLGFALVFAVLPGPLFGLLTDRSTIIAQIGNHVLWLFPVLGFGSLAYMLDGYFLGLTAGLILRNSSLSSSLLGFAPAAWIAWQTGSNHLLWLALTFFMAARMLTLGIQVPKTLKDSAVSVGGATEARGKG
ncbi:MAG: guanitoxin biosynthesis MATE family efflux transporter GntT [Cyanophyceae cyanobacterium]